MFSHRSVPFPASSLLLTRILLESFWDQRVHLLEAVLWCWDGNLFCMRVLNWHAPSFPGQLAPQSLTRDRHFVVLRLLLNIAWAGDFVRRCFFIHFPYSRNSSKSLTPSTCFSLVRAYDFFISSVITAVRSHEEEPMKACHSQTPLNRGPQWITFTASFMPFISVVLTEHSCCEKRSRKYKKGWDMFSTSNEIIAD